MARLPRTDSDLLAGLHEQISFLTKSCAAFDAGDESEAKRIALTIRIFLHDTRFQTSLFSQLGLHRRPFLDSGGRGVNPRNLLPESTLTIMRISNKGYDYVARCTDPETVVLRRWLTFPEWWDSDVIRDTRRRSFARKDLILSVADQDGGAHIDPTIDEAYAALSRDNPMGWRLEVNGETTEPANNPTLPSIRQIAHEVLETLRSKWPEILPAHLEFEADRQDRAARRRALHGQKP